MSSLGKLIVTIGISLVLGGLVWEFFGKSLHLGKLPGDLTFQKGGMRFYFPITTSIIASVVLSLLFYIFRKLGK